MFTKRDSRAYASYTRAYASYTRAYASYTRAYIGKVYLLSMCFDGISFYNLKL
jgi:hypothetical protein